MKPNVRGNRPRQKHPTVLEDNDYPHNSDAMPGRDLLIHINVKTTRMLLLDLDEP